MGTFSVFADFTEWIQIVIQNLSAECTYNFLTFISRVFSWCTWAAIDRWAWTCILQSSYHVSRGTRTAQQIVILAQQKLDLMRETHVNGIIFITIIHLHHMAHSAFYSHKEHQQMDFLSKFQISFYKCSKKELWCSPIPLQYVPAQHWLHAVVPTGSALELRMKLIKWKLIFPAMKSQRPACLKSQCSCWYTHTLMLD
jgi:hypothetical protein